MGTAQLIVLSAALGLQFLITVAGLLFNRMAARDYYRLSSLSLCLATGVLLTVQSPYVALTGLLAALFAWAALTEPARRRRHLSLVRQLRTLKGAKRS